MNPAAVGSRGRARARRRRRWRRNSRDHQRRGRRGGRLGGARRQRSGRGWRRQAHDPGDDRRPAWIAGGERRTSRMHLSRGLGEKEARLRRLRLDEGADDRLVLDGIAGEQKPRHRRGATRAVTEGADVHQDRVHRGRERRATGRQDRRRKRGRGRRGKRRRRGGSRWRRRWDWRRLRGPRLTAFALVVSLRFGGPGYRGGFLAGRVIEAGARANPGQHPLIGGAAGGPGGPASVQHRARRLLEELARFRGVDVSKPRQRAVIGLRVARQDEGRGARRAARGVAGLAGARETAGGWPA